MWLYIWLCVVDSEHRFLSIFFSSVLLLLCITEQLHCCIYNFSVIAEHSRKNIYIKDHGSGPSDKTVGSGGKQAVREAQGTELSHRDAEMSPQLGRTFASSSGRRAGQGGW